MELISDEGRLYVVTSKEDSSHVELAKLANFLLCRKLSGPGRMKIAILWRVLVIMDNGNDPPARTDEKQKITNYCSGLINITKITK